MKIGYLKCIGLNVLKLKLLMRRWMQCSNLCIYIYTVRRKRVYTGSASGINCLHGADRICNVGVKVMLSEVIWKRLCAINITGQSCAQQAYKTLKRYCCY